MESPILTFRKMSDQDFSRGYRSDGEGKGNHLVQGSCKGRGRIDCFVSERYKSFQEGIGKRIIDNEVTLEEISDYALEKKNITDVMSGNQEGLQSILNSVLFG